LAKICEDVGFIVVIHRTKVTKSSSKWHSKSNTPYAETTKGSRIIKKMRTRMIDAVEKKKTL